MRAVRWIAWVCALLAPLLLAQNNGAVVGTVVNSISGVGVPGMNVLLWAKGAQYEATTDDTGTFRIDEVAPGSYRSRYDKEEFVPLQRDKDLIVVTSAPEPVRVRVEMSPYATLRGRVLDPDGKPINGVEVALRCLPTSAWPSKLQCNYTQFTARTEGDGSFLFPRLTAGSYVLLATPDPGTGRIALVPTYFPSAEERVQAQKLMVRAGIDLSGYEIHLRDQPVYRLGGVVVDEAGKPVPRAEVRLVSTMEGMSAPPGYSDQGVIILGTLKRETEIGMVAGEDGAFQFSSVRPGPWRLVANHQSRPGDELKSISEIGAVSVTVADHDIENLRLRIEPAVTLQGTVEFKDAHSTAANRGGLMLMTADGQGSVVAVSQPDGTLRVPNLVPGPYRFLALPGPTFAFAPISVLLGDREVLGQVVELTEPAPPLRVLYNANTGSVRGVVEKGACDLIVLLSNPALPPFAGRAQPCKAGESFEILGVPPGDYYALAFDHVDQTSPPDLPYLMNFLPNAARLSIGKGPPPLIQLSITHLP